MIELGDNVYQLFAQLGNAVPVVFISSIFLVLLYFGIKMCSTKIATLEKEEMNLMEREHEELKDKEMTLLVSRGGGGGVEAATAVIVVRTGVRARQRRKNKTITWKLF